MPFQLPKLPYALDALVPLLSAETLEFHYGRHHRSYVEKLNRLIAGTPFAKSSLVEIIQGSDGAVFNNAAQAWNHEFYWNSLSPPKDDREGSEPFVNQIKKDFGSIDNLKRSIRECGLNTFGSGWAWLVKNEAGRLRVVSTRNADNPIRAGLIPLLTCDVWEHAYYIDYRNERAKYMDAFLKQINLTHASQCFAQYATIPLFASAYPQSARTRVF